jgi:ATP-dependent Clp protease, protease subunit
VQKIEKKLTKGYNLNTTITEDTEMGEIPVDIYQKMADNRILFICNHIDDKIATDTVASLLLKDNENPGEKITIFINSDGGDIRNVFMIYDMMQLIQSPIETICIGSAMDEAAIILAAGTPGMRYATKHAAIAVSQLVNQWMNYSDLTDAKKNLDLYVNDNKKMMEIIGKCSKKTFKQTMIDFERRVFMNASQAIKYGIIDKLMKFSK